MPGLGSCTTDLNVVMMVDVLLEPGELVLAADSPLETGRVERAVDEPRETLSPADAVVERYPVVNLWGVPRVDAAPATAAWAEMLVAIAAMEGVADPSGEPAAHDADMTEAQRRAEIDRMMRDLDVWERSPEGRRRLGVLASPPRPPPVEVRAKGRRRR